MALSSLQTRQERTGTLSRPMENVIVWTFLLPLFLLAWRLPETYPKPYLVPVRRYPSPSRSIHLSEARGCLDHMTRNTLASRNNEAYGLGNLEPKIWE